MSFEPNEFVTKIKKIKIANHFNPYVDTCTEHDAPKAPEFRSANLLAYLTAIKAKKINIALIGPAYGYLGGRRTGLPMTDEKHLINFQKIYQTSNLHKATTSPGRGEITASIVWGIIPEFRSPVLLWNIAPLHPHQPNKPASNSKHSAIARSQSLPLLEELLTHFNPSTIIALGREAEDAILKTNRKPTYCRHPAHAGVNAFKQKMVQLQKEEASNVS